MEATTAHWMIFLYSHTWGIQFNDFRARPDVSSEKYSAFWPFNVAFLVVAEPESGVCTGGADSQTPTLAGRRRRVHLQPLAEAARQDLAAHQREARVAFVPDDVACGEGSRAEL